MFSPLYFPLLASLAAQDRLSIERVSEGRIAEALSSSSRVMETASWKGKPDIVRLVADFRLAADQLEDAEDGYRKSLKSMRTSHQFSALSCRDTAWQTLFRHRSTATALNLWSRVVADVKIDPDRRREARFGLVVTLGEMGRLSEMGQALDEFEGDMEGANPLWGDIGRLLRYDMAIQNDIRQSEPLTDHVYWQSLLRDMAPEEARELQQPLTSPLLRMRYECLQNLKQLARGNRDAFAPLDTHMRWAQQEGLPDYQRALRIEIAIAALSGGLWVVAEQVMQPIGDYVREANGRRLLEQLYCTAKIRREQGRTQDWVRLYGRYALGALCSTRDAALAPSPYSGREAGRADAPLDDVAARLPAKYRRAYRYLLANLERRDLSVREIAREISVTERALQTAFKNFIGLTPTEVIRRRRMELIHAELSSQTNDKSVLSVANKWGVMHRSTLVNGYRKYFDEVPSATLAR